MFLYFSWDIFTYTKYYSIYSIDLCNMSVVITFTVVGCYQLDLPGQPLQHTSGNLNSCVTLAGRNGRRKTNQRLFITQILLID